MRVNSNSPANLATKSLCVGGNIERWLEGIKRKAFRADGAAESECDKESHEGDDNCREMHDIGSSLITGFVVKYLGSGVWYEVSPLLYSQDEY